MTGAGGPGAVTGAGGPAPVGGLLAVHAHPDDETLWTGALLATWAAAGLPVTVVTCTRGERGEVIPAELAHLAADPSALGAHRSAEVAGALAALGVTDGVLLDEVADPAADRDGAAVRWVDSGMVWDAGGRAMLGEQVPDGAFALVDVDAAARRLAEVIADRRPVVVVGYEPGGGYGHPDHVQAHRVMMRAVEQAAADGWPVRCVLWAAADLDALVAAREACAVDAPEGLRSSVGAAVPSAAVPRPELDLLVPVGPVLPQVLAALRSHATQVQAVGVLPAQGVPARYALSGGLLEPLLDPEVYRFAPGWDGSAVRWPAGVRVP